MDFHAAYQAFREFADDARAAGRTVRGHAAAQIGETVRDLATESGVQGHMKTLAFEGGHQLRRGAAQARRRGDMLSAALYTKGAEIAHGIMQRAGSAQKHFENVAKVRRGDMSGLSDSDLRSVVENGHKFARPGEDPDSLKKAAHEERVRRIASQESAGEEFRRSRGSAVTKEEKDARKADAQARQEQRAKERTAQHEARQQEKQAREAKRTEAIAQRQKDRTEREAKRTADVARRREDSMQRRQDIHTQKIGHMEDKMRRKEAIKQELRQARKAATTQNHLPTGSNVVRATQPMTRAQAVNKLRVDGAAREAKHQEHLAGRRQTYSANKQSANAGHKIETTKTPAHHSLQRGAFGGMYYQEGGQRIYVKTPGNVGKRRAGMHKRR